MPSIEARPSTKMVDWYVLEPGEEAYFTSKLRNNFVNFWIGEDYPWTYFFSQRTKNLKSLWYGPIKITDNITVMEGDEGVPEVRNGHIKLKVGYGAITSFGDTSTENELSDERIDKIEHVLTIITVTIIIVLFCFLCVYSL